MFSEFFGTFRLVAVAAGGPVVNAVHHGQVPVDAQVVAPGVMVMAIIYFMGMVSGAHPGPGRGGLIPVLAGLLGKQRGFSRSVRRAPVFYGLVTLGTMGGTAMSLLHVNPIKLLVLVAVINGVAAAPFLVSVASVSSSKRILGD